MKKAIVAGVGPERGLGAQLGIRFAGLGLHVLVAGRTAEKLEAVVNTIAFPGSALPARLKRLARWFNYFDPDDVLRYPIAPLGGRYRELVRDISINVGSIAAAWNPASHAGYWADNSFTVPVARYLSELLESAPAT